MDPLHLELLKRANDRQVDGTHYCKYGTLQPWDMWIPWNLNGFQCEVLKLVVRYRDKNGTKDLLKAIHYLEKLIEVENEAKNANQKGDAVFENRQRPDK